MSNELLNTDIENNMQMVSVDTETGEEANYYEKIVCHKHHLTTTTQKKSI